MAGGGGEASAIYEQFAHTPLKIRPAKVVAALDHAATPSRQYTSTSASGAADGDVERAAGAIQQKLNFDSSPEADTAARTEVLVSPSGPSPPPLPPTTKELLALSAHKDVPVSQGSTTSNAHSASAKTHAVKTKRADESAIVAAAGDVAMKVDALREGSVGSKRKRKALRAVASKSTLPSTAASESAAEPTVEVRKSKRVLRPRKPVKPATAAKTADAPPPVKRRRTTPSKASSTTDSKNTSTTGSNEGELAPEADSESRSLLSAFIDCIGNDEKELSTPQKIVISLKKKSARRRSLRPATPPARRSRRILLTLPDAQVPVDYITNSCDELLSTNTISGALFSVALNSLRGVQEEFLQTQPPRSSNPFRGVSSICMGIATCEQLAESHNESGAKLPSLLSRRRGSRSSVAAKKSVRFQSFDLSCLNLHYVRNAHTEAMVDRILCNYDEIMRNIASMLQSHTTVHGDSAPSNALEVRIFRDFVRALNDNSMLFINPDTLASEAERIYLAAFESRDPHTQHEIQAGRSYYATEFQKLVAAADDASAAPPAEASSFLQDMFSSLVSSSLRFKLRALFLEYEAELDDDAFPSMRMAAYTHQDFGSAVHCALQESLLYAPLAEPVIALLGEKTQAMEYLENAAAGDLEQIEQYVLARRFLGFHVKTAYEAPSPDGFATKTWENIEQLCGIAKRYNFDDEAHFFPLASVKDFVAELEVQEPTLLQLETTLGDFNEQKNAQSSEQSHFCLECNQVIARQEAMGSIVCITCAGHFHLSCLHLPPSFAQFASHYTCPSCFLGRRR